MEISNQKRVTLMGIEENTLAILDSTGTKETRDANDDRLAFIEAVRAASFLPESGSAPTYNMHEALFHILRAGKSLELIMSSYQLLIEINKHFPRVYVSKSSPSKLVVFNEDWLPFVFSPDAVVSERQAAGGNSTGPLYFTGFTQLIQELDEFVSGTNFQAIDIECIRNMLLLQYLVAVLEGDFLPRKIMYEETSNWNLLRESMLNVLLGGRRINYKALVMNFLSILSGLSQVHVGSNSDGRCSDTAVTKESDDCDPALTFALFDLEKSTCVSVQNLLKYIMELDVSKQNADKLGHTTRADGPRTPVIEIILDVLNYEREMISPFFQAFTEPKWKLEIILQYFSKYITTKPSVRTRRSNGSPDDSTFHGMLKYFSKTINLKNFIKKINSDIVQLLLAHAFQAHLLIVSQDIDNEVDAKEQLGNSSHAQICKDIISAFKNFKSINGDFVLLPIAKEALFTAATIDAMNA